MYASPSEKLTPEILAEEYSKWTTNYGDGKNENHIRFGQHLWARYKIPECDEPGKDGYYDRSAAAARGVIEQLLLFSTDD